MSEPVQLTDKWGHPRRLKSCVEEWPDCVSGEYNPSCCRFPKSCSCDIYSEEHVQEDWLEPLDDSEPAVSTAPDAMSEPTSQEHAGWLARWLVSADTNREILRAGSVIDAALPIARALLQSQKDLDIERGVVKKLSDEVERLEAELLKMKQA